MYDKDPNSQMNLVNTMGRVCRIEPTNISHYVTAYKVTPEKTYFEIKTNPANPIIVNAILAGKRPAFSIRTRGDFSTRDDGVIVANKLEVLTIDYVGNPANSSSVSFPTIKAFDCVDGNKKDLELNLLPKTGTESFGMESAIPKDCKLMYDDSLDPIDALGNMLVVPKNKPKKTMSFESAMGFACNSFFD